MGKGEIVIRKNGVSVPELTTILPQNHLGSNAVLFHDQVSDIEAVFWASVTWTLTSRPITVSGKKDRQGEITAEFLGETMKRSFMANGSDNVTPLEQAQRQMQLMVHDIISRVETDKNFRSKMARRVAEHLREQYDESQDRV